MSEFLNWLVIIVALILVGVFATFFIVLNYVKTEIKRMERLENINNDEVKK